MDRFASLIQSFMRLRDITSSELSDSAGFSIDELLAGKSVTDDEKRRLCSILHLDADYVLALPDSYDDGAPAVKLHPREPITEETQRILKRTFDVAYADLDYQLPDDLY